MLIQNLLFIQRKTEIKIFLTSTVIKGHHTRTVSLSWYLHIVWYLLLRFMNIISFNSVRYLLKKYFNPILEIIKLKLREIQTFLKIGLFNWNLIPGIQTPDLTHIYIVLHWKWLHELNFRDLVVPATICYKTVVKDNAHICC